MEHESAESDKSSEDESESGSVDEDESGKDFHLFCVREWENVLVLSYYVFLRNIINTFKDILL